MKIVVTGAAGGIGEAIVLKFLQMGHEVYGLDRNVSGINNSHYHHFVTDIRDTGNLPEIEGTEILINCAGTQNEADIDVNLKALIHVTEKYGVREGIYSILHIGSASGHTGSEFPEYAASKGGVIAYTKNTALRVAVFHATCNSLDPGGVITPLNKPVMDDPELFGKIMDETPLRRWATADEIAEWAYFLTVINRFCTGESIVVDGGESINHHFIWTE